MTMPSTIQPPDIPSRERQAYLEVGRTDIGPGAARAVVIGFLLLLFGVPLVGHADWLLAHLRGEDDALPYREWSGTGAGLVHAAGRAYGLDLVLAPNAVLRERIDAFEHAYDEELFLTRLSTPPVQALLCRVGVGNEEAYVGSDGWLFYRPAVQALTAPPFLDPDRLDAVGRNEPRVPDPRPAILDFHAGLAERGIALVLLPVPGKAAVHPEHLAGVAAAGPIRRNPSWDRWLADLEAAGVEVFDPAPRIRELRDRHGEAYLRTDTHWRPEVMQAVAADLAAHLRDRHGEALAAGGELACTRSEREEAHIGDIAAMLRLPAGQTLYPPQTVTVRPVVGPAGEPCEPGPGGGVLLLGDSFTNIYSLAQLGWGTHAGLAEQLACELGRPVDRLAQNDAGAHATRLALAGQPGRLRDVRVVVWEFAARELVVGDWPVIALPDPPPEDDGAMAAKAALGVTGTVVAVSGRPEQGAAYADFVMKLHLQELSATGGTGKPPAEAIVHVLAMRDRELLPAARIRVGQRVEFALVPWSAADPDYHAFKSGSFEDMMLELRTDLDRYWALPAEETP